MQDLIFIILIFIEIIITYFAIINIIKLKKHVEFMDKQIIEHGYMINLAHLKFQKNIKNLNRFVSIFTNKKFIFIKKIIVVLINSFEMFFLIRSFNFSKGIKFNLKSFKKLIFATTTRQILKKVINYIMLVCK